MRTRQLRLSRPLHLRQTVAPLRVHLGDPTLRVSSDELVRATRTPDGPATLACRVFDGGFVDAGAWGPGADHVLEALPALLGERDDRSGFEPALHPVVARAHRRHPGLRINATGDVEDVLVPSILGQRVTGDEATSAFRGLVRRHGEPAPGPHDGLLVRPPAAWYLAEPEHTYRRLGVELQRERTIRAACRNVARLQEAASMPTARAEARLRSVPGLGVWTAALVQRIAFGDPDPIEVGDHHVPHTVAWALAGEARGSDDRMVELLEPWRGQRGRVVRLLKLTVGGAPRRGARQRIVNSATLARGRRTR
jgi:3-methyladenine DNA glycosylase/8-oxoguanine DNA glycosylase